MAGGLIQLVAYGIQDLYLTGDPQITFFKVIYRRHTNFSFESVRQNFATPGDFGNQVTCILARTGDLVGEVFLHVEIPAIIPFINKLTLQPDKFKKFAWVRNLGYALIKEMTVEIGGKLIDRQYGEWLYIWQELSDIHNKSGVDKMIGNVPSMYDFSNGKETYKLYIPLKFWFCNNNGLALPMVALASSDVRINFIFRRLEECCRIGPTNYIEILEDFVPFKAGDYIEQIVNGSPIYGYVVGYDYVSKRLYYIKINSPNAIRKSFVSLQEANASQTVLNSITYVNNIPYRIYDSITGKYCTPRPNTIEIAENTTFDTRPNFVNSFLYVNYIYLDSAERVKFARSNHEYLMEQVQFNRLLGVKSPNVKFNLTLSQPCKSHYWVAQLDSLVGAGTINDLFNYTTSHIRYRDGRLYGENLVKEAVIQLNGQDRFSPRSGEYFNLVQPYQCQTRGPEKGINMYSFAINPEKQQPSSTCNMSKINDIDMLIKLQNVVNQQNTITIRSYTLNYNILRVFFNLGGIAFI